MSGKTKPKTRRRIWPLLNPMTVALNNATTLTAEETAQVFAPIRAALEAMRTGKASYADWIQLSTCVQVAQAIEALRVVRGLRMQLAEAAEHLAAIEARALKGEDWTTPTLYGHELVSLQTLVQIHAFQVQQLSAAEFRAAVSKAKAEVIRNGGRAIIVGATQ